MRSEKHFDKLKCTKPKTRNNMCVSELRMVNFFRFVVVVAAVVQSRLFQMLVPLTIRNDKVFGIEKRWKSRCTEHHCMATLLHTTTKIAFIASNV